MCGLLGLIKRRWLIAASVEDTCDQYAVGVWPVVDDVALDCETPDTRCDLVACPPGTRMIGEERESVDNIADDLIGGVDARVLRDSQPNVVEIRFGQRRQPYRLIAWRFSSAG